MNLKQRKRWKKVRAKGMWHYIFIYGILIFGFITAIISLIILEALEIYNIKPSPFPNSFNLERLLIVLILAPIIGFISGYLMWKICEKDYLNN